MAVSITGLTASVLLFYYWLKSRKTDTGTAFILSLMFLLAGPMIGQYSGQIMFVDYMPFLCLALIGVDRYFEQEKSGLFTVSVFLMIMTSFYFSIGGMLSLFFMDCTAILNKEKETGSQFCSFFAGRIVFRAFDDSGSTHEWFLSGTDGTRIDGWEK